MPTDRLAQVLDDVRTASAAERVLWERVKGKHPASPGHDAKAWAEWLAAANVVRDLAEQLRKLGE